MDHWQSPVGHSCISQSQCSAPLRPTCSMPVDLPSWPRPARAPVQVPHILALCSPAHPPHLQYAPHPVQLTAPRPPLRQGGAHHGVRHHHPPPPLLGLCTTLGGHLGLGEWETKHR